VLKSYILTINFARGTNAEYVVSGKP